MVTTQRFGGLSGRVTAAQFAGLLGQQAAGSCPGGRATEVTEEGGAAQVRADCPTNPETGLLETFIARAVMGTDDLHVFQVAWRRVPTKQDIAWGENYLRGISFKR
jgi:hypothetical protein